MEKTQIDFLWKNHFLKSLALSKLVYPLSILKTPPEEFIILVQDKFDRFLWEGKRSKMTLANVVQPLEKGGLNYPCIKSFILSQKTAWIKRLLDEENNAKWKLFCLNKIKRKYGFPNCSIFFNCNYKYNHASSIFGSSFLDDLCKSWSQINYKEIPRMTADEIGKQIIWLNSSICSKNIPIVSRSLAAKGLIYVKDIFNEYGVLKSCVELSVEFRESNFLEILRTIKSVPKPWLNEMRGINIQVGIIDNFVSIPKSKSIYKSLIQRKYDYNFNLLNEYWIRKVNVAGIDWKLIFKLISKISIINKIKDFSFRFINRIIYSDLKLYFCKHRQSTLFSFCSKDIGDFIHNYWNCPVVQTFIATTMGWYNGAMHTDLKLDIGIYFLGSYSTNRRLDIFTEFFYWVMKWFIHCCRHGSKIPTLHHFKVVLKIIHEDEKAFALKKDKLDQHNRKWLIPVRQLGILD